MKRTIILALIAAVALSVVAFGSAQIGLHTFTPGDPILSDEVNENFEALRDGIETAVDDVRADRYSFTIQAGDWDSGLHYGDGNVHRRYAIPDGQVGGVDLGSFWASGGAIIVYARPLTAGYNELKMLPHMWSEPTDADPIGIKLEHMPARNAIVISRTTMGWDNLLLAEEDLPDSIEVTVVLIPADVGP